MKLPRGTWFGMAVCCLGILTPVARSGQSDLHLTGIKRIYVETFPEKAGSQKIREDLMVQLRKQGSFSIVPSEAEADAVIAGDGETWIKGYRSLNPRSGRLPSNGDPVYAGFLSVELRDTKGETLWSYLVTLGPASEAITKDLSKQVVKHLLDALK